MAFPKYIAWLNGTSVARGSLSEVEKKAREIAKTQLWKQTHENKTTVLKITTDGRQLFVSSYVL